MNILRLIAAMVAVESGGNNSARGAHDELGCLQIRRQTVDDINRIVKKQRAFTYDDRLSRDKSVEMLMIYVSHYLSPVLIGREPTEEDVARLWNGGPKYKHKAWTKSYWLKVQAQMKLAPE